MKEHETHVVSQFGPQAAAYVASAVHASGPDLEALERIVAAKRPENALDLGTGGGHVAYRLTAHATQVTAVDLSADMLAAVAATASDRGLGNLLTVESAVETLPFEDGAFDFLACRYSAHHWSDLEAGIRQARRVLKSGSPAVFIDAVAAGPALADTHLQAVELLRDTSHVRDYSPAEWMAVLARTGFAVENSRMFRVRMDFKVWIARMRTPDENARVIRKLQDGASQSVRRHFAIEDDGSFMLDVMMVEARAA